MVIDSETRWHWETGFLTAKRSDSPRRRGTGRLKGTEIKKGNLKVKYWQMERPRVTRSHWDFVKD